jgi:hypothetical protein
LAPLLAHILYDALAAVKVRYGEGFRMPAHCCYLRAH